MAQAVNNKTGSFNSALFGSFTLYKAVLNSAPFAWLPMGGSISGKKPESV